MGGRDDFDRRAAAAEAQLERLDDAMSEGDTEADDRSAPLTVTDRAVVVDDESIHIEDEWFPPEDESEEEPVGESQGPDAHLTNCIEAFIEAFNARDLDGLLDLVAPDCETPGLGGDVDNFPDAVEDLWERRPSVLLTRGVYGGGPVGVLWELSDDDSWWPLATTHFSDVDDGRVGVIAFSTDQQPLDAVVADAPDGDVEEGVRWAEWDEGAGDG